MLTFLALGLCHSCLRLFHNWRRSTASSKNTCFIFSYWSRIVDQLLNHWRVYLNVNKYSIAVLSCPEFTLVDLGNSAMCIQFNEYALKAKNDTGKVVFEVSKFIYLTLKQITLLKGKAQLRTRSVVRSISLRVLFSCEYINGLEGTMSRRFRAPGSEKKLRPLTGLRIKHCWMNVSHHTLHLNWHCQTRLMTWNFSRWMTVRCETLQIM